MLSSDERRRYARHLAIPEVGLAGQLRLQAARVLLVGAGGLGSPAAMYLAAAGVGTLALVDDDTVDLSNLQRQLLHRTATIGHRKVDSGKATLAEINPHVQVDTYPARLDAALAAELFPRYDVIVDGSDNFATRYLVNDACVAAGKPLVSGCVLRFEGQVTVCNHQGGPCYRCLFPTPPDAASIPDCATAGVLGVLPGLVGTIQAIETLKLLLGQGQPLSGRLLLIQALTMRFRDLKYRRDPACPGCGRPAGAAPPPIPVPPPAGATTCRPTSPEPAMSDYTALQVHAKLAAKDPFVLLDVREDEERARAHIPGDTLHIPLGELPDRLGELDKTKELVVYCHLGGRSGQAVRFLREEGFTNVHNLTGGITAWNNQVKPAKK